MATFARAPLIQVKTDRIWIRVVHTEGHSSSPLTLTATYPPQPHRQYDWPTPPARQTITSIPTWLGGNNPDIYANPKPVGGQADYATPPQTFRYDPLQRTWAYSVAGYINPQPFTQSNWPTPSPLPYASSTASWTLGSTPYIPRPIRQRHPLISKPPERPWVWGVHDQGGVGSTINLPFVQMRSPAAAVRIGPTWVPGVHDGGCYSTTALYTVLSQSPFNNTNWPVPAAWVYDNGLRTWISQNINVTANPSIVGTQLDYSVPPSLPYDLLLRTWASGNPSIFASVTPVGLQADYTAPLPLPYGLHLRTWLVSALPSNIPPAPVVTGGDELNKERVGIVASGRLSDGNPSVGGQF